MLSLQDAAQIADVVVAVATVVAVVVGFRQLRTQLAQANHEREVGFAQMKQQLELAQTEQKTTRELHEVEFIGRLEDRFDGRSMLMQRRFAATFLLNPPQVPHERWHELSDFIDFFQALGTITRLGHIREELAYKWFFYWIAHYLPAMKEYIEDERRGRPDAPKPPKLLWADALWLYEKLSEFDRLHNDGAWSNPSAEALKAFFLWEIDAIEGRLERASVGVAVDSDA